MKFQINVYRPGRKGKAIKGMKTISRESSPSRLPGLIFLGMILLIVLGFAALYSRQIGTLKGQIRQDQKRIMTLRQFLEEGTTGQNRRSGMEEALIQLEKERVTWQDKLVELSRLVPDDIRLSRLGIEKVETIPDPTKPRQKVIETFLTIKGEVVPAPGQESLDHIARLIMNLNESPVFKIDFEPLVLVYTQRVKTREREFMEFKLSGRMQLPSKKV
jgi:hypothetical protein